MKNLVSRVLVRSASCFLMVLAPLAAQTEREIEAAEARIRAMGRQVEELQAQGKHEAAEEVARRMREMRQELRAHLARRERGERGEREEILHGLEQGMHALERLGRRDAMDLLRQIAEEVRDEGEHPEVREARRQLEILRTAQVALREGERGDAAELMHLAIRARELNLEGRRDEEAQALRRRAPDREQTVELLRLSAALWADFGHERRAAATAELAEQMMGRGRRGEREREREHEGEREEPGEHERGREREEEHEREREPDEGGLAERLRRLEERLSRIERALERLGRERRDR